MKRQYLSVEGIDDLLTALGNRAELTQKSCWVCDHTLLSAGAFDEQWMVTKTEEGSKVAQQSQVN
jgi:hypothetical protein